MDTTYREEGGFWHPSPLAAGPFGGLHGGGVSGVLIAGLERKARAEGYGVPLSATVLFLRPAPMAPMASRIEIIRAGGRVAVLENTLTADGRLIARATASFVAGVPPLAVEHMPRLAQEPHDPEILPVLELAPAGLIGPTFFDTLDLRDDGAGTKWGRLRQPIVDFPAPLATVFAIADNGQPFALLPRPRPNLRFPNIDITVHLSRAPEGPWLGVTAHSDWRDEGYGLTEGALRDTRSTLGRSCQTVVLAPVS